jgi:hypothetical protein
MFIVTAYRYGSKDYHFPMGIFETKEDAIKSAKFHREYRGGKYDHKCAEIELSKVYDAKIIELNGEWITGGDHANMNDGFLEHDDRVRKEGMLKATYKAVEWFVNTFSEVDAELPPYLISNLIEFINK